MGITAELFGEEAEVIAANPVEQKKEEVSEVAAETTEETNEKTLYTPEELTALLQDENAEIDTSRLSLEGQATMKSFQRGFTAKFEQIAKLRKELEKQRQEAEQKKAPKDKTIEDYFADDPEGTLADIDKVIAQRMQEADKFEDEGDDRAARKAFKEALSWSTLKSTLVAKEVSLSKKEQKQARETEKIRGTVTDFEKKRETAVEVMKKQMPMLSEEQIDELVDPSRNGIKAAELVKHFYSEYEKAQAIENAKNKINKETPSSLGRAGSQEQVKRVVEDDYDATFEKWKKTPNDPVLTAKLLKLKGAI